MNLRRILVVLAAAVTLYFASRGVTWWSSTIDYSALLLSCVAFYLAVSAVVLFCGFELTPRRPESFPGHTPGRMPLWVALVGLAAAVLLPSAVWIAVGDDSRTSIPATWPIGAVGVLMTAVMVGRRTLIAWIGTIAMGVQACVWISPLAAAQYGLIGSIVWVGATQLLVRSLAVAARDTERFAELQQAAMSWQASQGGRQRERRERVQRALAVAGPVLGRTIVASGALNEEERAEARLAEGILRDELRGGRLLDDRVRRELENARRRGTKVTVLDEGGLDGLSEPALNAVRTELADTLETANSERLFIRTSPHAQVAVTIVGRAPGAAGLSDEDAVDLWHEIPRPGENPA